MDLKKNNLNPGTVIIFVSCVVFWLRLYACRYVHPLHDSMDYYGYRELAKNIVHHLDFTVRWELDEPVRYPPLFPILVYLFTFLTKNFMTSIQLISVFSASFLLIPLFSLVRNILNVTSASFAVLFAIYYFGVKPCYMPNMDFFFSLLVIVICWLIWDTLTHRSLQAGRYILAGFLVSIAYLTKYSGGLFGLSAMASILYYFARNQGDFRRGLQMSAWLLLGAAPLMVGYHLMLNQSSPKQSPSIGTYAFYDGNYMYDKGWLNREEKMSELNAQGTQFGHIDRVNSLNEFDVMLKDPPYVFNKYLWGLDKMTQEMTFSVLPGGYIPKSKILKIGQNGDKVLYALMMDGWNDSLREVSPKEVVVNPYFNLTKESIRKRTGQDFEKVWKILDRSRSSRKFLNVLFHGDFLILLVVSGTYYRWHFNLMHILFFTIGMVLIPFYFINERYLMPYMLQYFVLWLFIVNAGFGIVEGEIKDKNFLRNLVLLGFVCLLFIYSADSAKQIQHGVSASRDAKVRKAEWGKVASWIRKDSTHPFRRMKIMTCSDNYLSYITDSDYIRLPYVLSDWNKVLNFAVFKKVDYIVAEWYNLYNFLTFSENEFKKPLTPQALLGAIKAANARSRDMTDMLAAATPLESLNKLLGYRDLYQIMPLRPARSVNFIEQLKTGGDYDYAELKQTNRLLIELNYPKEAPHKLMLNNNTYGGPSPIKMIHAIEGEKDTYWIYRL
jgi:hypothetical protein